MTPRTGCRPAATLLEMSALMWAFAILLVVGTVLIVGAFQMDRTAGASLDRLTAHSVLADQFRADVALAASAPESAGDVKAGPLCLILVHSDGKHIVYRWLDQRLARSESTDEDTTEQHLTVGPDCTAVEFIRSGGERPIITLRLTEPVKASGIERRKEISAALGGDLR